MKFFILSGGLGTRARPLSYTLPKPLFPVNGTPVIEILLNSFRRCGLSKGFINLHYKGEMLKDALKNDYGITFIDEPVLSGSMILKKALPMIEDEWLFIINGDVLMEIPADRMINRIKESSCDGLLLTRATETDGYPSLVFKDKRFRHRIFKSPPGSPMYTGAAILHRRVIEQIDTLNFFETLERGGFNITHMDYSDMWLDLGSPSSYYSAERSFCPDRTKNSLSAGASIDGSATVSGSILWPDSRIEGNSIIKNCIVTASTVVQNCKAENSIITSNGIFDI